MSSSSSTQRSKSNKRPAPIPQPQPLENPDESIYDILLGSNPPPIAALVPDNAGDISLLRNYNNNNQSRRETAPSSFSSSSDPPQPNISSIESTSVSTSSSSSSSVSVSSNPQSSTVSKEKGTFPFSDNNYYTRLLPPQSFFTNTGIPFIDAALSSSPPPATNEKNGIVLEIKGKTNTGKSTTMLCLAVGFVVSHYHAYHTSNVEKSKSNIHKKSKTRSMKKGEGEVIIIDIDNSLIIQRLVQITRAKVVAAYEQVGAEMEGEDSESIINEFTAWVLGRIHIVRPKSFGSCVAALEGIRQSIPSSSSKSNSGTLICINTLGSQYYTSSMIDSLSNQSFTSKGVMSGANAFYINLQTLRQTHHIHIIGIVPSFFKDTSTYNYLSNTIWDKHVSCRVELLEVLPGGKEEGEKYDFVCVCKGVDGVGKFFVDNDGVGDFL